MNQLDSVILRLHEAAVRPEIWSEVMRELSGLFDDRPLMYGVQWLPGGISFMQSVHMPKEIVQRIVAEYSSISSNPMMRAAVPALKLHEPFPLAELIPPQELEQTQYYKETIGQMGGIEGEFAVASHLAPTRMTVLVLARRADQPAADTRQLQTLARLSPHLGLAMEVMVRMGRLDAAKTALSHALCRVAQPVALLDATGIIIFANPALEDLVATNSAINFRAGRLQCTDREADHRLQDFVHDLSNSSNPENGNRSLTIESNRPIDRLSIIAQPIHSEFAQHLDLGGAKAILFVSHIGSMRLDLASVFSDFFQLSAQQTEIVRHITNGLDGPSIAERLSISPNTLKTHMNRIYEKTDTRSREELFRRLISLAAQAPVLEL